MNLINRVNIGDILKRTASRRPQQVAVIDRNHRLTYDFLNKIVNRTAHGFMSLGLRKGDRVAIITKNRWEFLAVFFAAAKTGVVSVPINVMLSDHEISYILTDSQTKAIVYDQDFDSRIHSVTNLTSCIEQSVSIREVPTDLENQLEYAKGRVIELRKNETDFHWLISQQPEHEIECFVEDRDPLQCMYTSGTTAKPKGVITSHLAAYMASCTAAIEHSLSKDDIHLGVLPLYHCAQLNSNVLPIFMVSSTFVLSSKFEPKSFAEMMVKERVTHVILLPMMYRAVLSLPHIEQYDFSSVKFCRFAMAPMPNELIEQGKKVFNAEFMLRFGQTEMLPPTSILPPEDVHESGAIGYPTLGIEVQIMDENGDLLPFGEIGEIVYRGPHVMTGYLNDLDKTREAFQFGWFHGGDIGYIDEKGLLWFVDRKKDIIKTGGENVSSLEIERLLMSHPGVQDVAVVGIPHPKWEEAVVAILEVKTGYLLSEPDLITYWKERLAGYKVPKRFLIMDKLPKTATGKIQKHLLRQEFGSLFSQ
jgi:acyl-CoA synthetase (AMP-forming)/AMP-acid ligase II